MPRLLLVLNDPVDFRLHRAPLVHAAVADGWEVHVAAPDEPAAADIRAAGLPFHALPIDRQGANPARDLRAALALAGLCRRLQPDVLHLRAVKAILCGGLAMRFCRRRPATVAHFCGLGWLFTGGGLRRRVLRSVAGHAMRAATRGRRSAAVTQTTADAATLLAHGLAEPSRLQVIAGSGVDCTRFVPAPEPDGPFTAVLPARLLASKGVPEFAAAARLLRGSGIRLVLVGGTSPGNPDAIPEAQVRAWVADGDLEWRGHCEDMPAVLAGAHAVCFPSYYGEGVPKAVLEAAAAGRALVVADIPGSRAVVEDGVSGLVVPPRDPVALAAALRRLADDPALRRRCAAAARQRAEREFALPVVVGAFLGLYRRLIAEPA